MLTQLNNLYLDFFMYYSFFMIIICLKLHISYKSI